MMEVGWPNKQLEFIAIGTNAKALKLFSLQQIIEKLPEQRDDEPL